MSIINICLNEVFVEAELVIENRKTFPIIEQCHYTLKKKIQMQQC